MWPGQIVVSKDKRTLSILWEDETKTHHSAQILRQNSPSAETRGHGNTKPIIPGSFELVHIENVEPVGNYAIRLKFSDGHNTGLYQWAFLYGLNKKEPAT